MKKKTTAKLKKDLDAVFSKYIRNYHTDKKGSLYCYTCGKHGKVKTMQCGHFVSRQYLATRWDENNCRPQCVGCNVWGNGQLLDFEEKLKKELSPRKVESMKAKRHQIIKLDANWYEKEITKYKEKLKEYDR